ncbi:hypothetical protein HY570_03940 [Candidatus Micrarchaeota archaeon]|nr:hypothetical protein [Candidatus Micrarchaeota archaeon]
MENLSKTSLRILELIYDEPLTLRDMEKQGVSRPTFLKFVNQAKKLGVIKTGELKGYYYILTKKGRKVLKYAKAIKKELERESEL